MLRLINNIQRPKNLFVVNYCSGIKKQVLDFDDSKTAYSSKTSRELIRSIVVLKLCSYQRLLDNNKTILDWMQKILGKRVFDYVMESTFYGQFVAGKNELEVEKVIKANRKYGVKPIIDFSVEDDVKEREDVSLIVDQSSLQLSNEHVPSINDKCLKTGDVRSFNNQFKLLESQCDRHLGVKLESIETIAKFTKPFEAFVAIKMSALGRPQLLLQLSEMFLQREKLFHLLVDHKTYIGERTPSSFRTLDLAYFLNRLSDLGVQLSLEDKKKWFSLLDTNNDQSVDLFDWCSLTHFKNNFINSINVKDEETGGLTPAISTLNEEGFESMRLMLERINRIAQYAQERKVKVLVDAEQSYLQPAIRRLALEMMRDYNKESVLIHNTYQCYSKITFGNVISDLFFSRRQPFKIGFKLVRGAYLEQERERAILKGYPDPIHPNFDATTEMYINCLNAAFEDIVNRKDGEVGVMVASHNEDTVHYALNKMKAMGIKPSDGAVCFGQLMGMCDHLTYTLGLNGYSVYKVVPYGPIRNVLPFLSRRALENRSIFQKVKKQNILLKRELWRRSTSRF